jgi:hypothetical protein
MNVGADDPQRPSLGGDPARPAAPQGPRDLSGPGAAPADERPVPDAGVSTGRATGPEEPVSGDRDGTAHRAPGMHGTTPSGERVETDVEASATAMGRDTGRPSGSGDSRVVSLPGQTPLEGSSEEHGVVQGARIPEE